MRTPCIALDLGGLDGLPHGGQRRYAVDLVRSLAALDLPARFVVLGAEPAPVADLTPAFARGDGKWAYQHFRRSTGVGSVYRDQARLALALLKARADLCHCLHTTAPVLAPCPVVATVLDVMFDLFPEYAEAVRSRPYRLFRWAVRHRARRVICISRTTADDVARVWAVPADRLDVVYLGLRVFGGDAAVEAPDADALRSLGAGPVVSSPLNLEPRKNLAAVLEAFPAVLARFPETRLVLFGRGGWAADREQAYRQTLERLRLTGRVVEPGLVSDRDLAWLYRRSEAFAFPSLYEGFGYPVLEAMAAGTCPVVRGHSAMAEVVGDAGVSVEPINPAALADGLTGLLGDGPRRRALGGAARRRSESFSSERMARETFDVYRKALRSGVPRRAL